MRRHSNVVVGLTTINQRGEMVLESTTEVAQQTTVYTFNGQVKVRRSWSWDGNGLRVFPGGPCGLGLC